MSTKSEYWLHNTDNEPVSGPYDTFQEAYDASHQEDPTAVIEYEFEYSDSSLVDPRYDIWPPDLVAELEAELTDQDDGIPVEIIVQGRRWFDRINGNTYHSVSVEVDGEVIGVEPFAYGYDDQYQQTAYEILIDKGILPKLTHGWGTYTLRAACEELNIDLTTDVRDVKKRELHEPLEGSNV